MRNPSPSYRAPQSEPREPLALSKLKPVSTDLSPLTLHYLSGLPGSVSQSKMKPKKQRETLDW